MVTLIKYGALSGGEKYNVNALSLDGLSTDTKPTRTYIEYGSDGREVGRTGIPNGSLYTEIDTGDTYMYDADNTTWHKVSIGGGGGGFTPTTEQLAAMNSGITAEDVEQIAKNKNNILLNTAEITGQQNATTDTVAGRGYAIINGQRLYMGAAQTPDRIGDIWLDGATVRESEYLLSSNPLCGISTYKDTLNLATGGCSRQIEKLELIGTEDWKLWSSGYNNVERFYVKWNKQALVNQLICSHMPCLTLDPDINHIRLGGDGFSDLVIYISKNIATTAEQFKTYLQQQYANGTPFTVWYILATPTTETITVPSGNIGTVEGYLIQDDTPTPTAPIYPMANDVLVWG